MASIANDLQLASKGRFTLGLGSQIKPHIERRFSMPWSHPAARMREFILAMRAIWAAWNGEEKLAFKGDFYTHTLMTPFFSLPPDPSGPPNLCPVTVIASRPLAAKSSGSAPNACTASEWNGTSHADATAASASIGWTVPTSLLAHMTVTSATEPGSAAMAVSSVSG